MDNVWTNLGNRLETAWKRPTRPNSKRPKDGEIIDEEKSVRWNREEAVRLLSRRSTMSRRATTPLLQKWMLRTILSDTMRKIGIFISRRPEP